MKIMQRFRFMQPRAAAAKFSVRFCSKSTKDSKSCEEDQKAASKCSKESEKAEEAKKCANQVTLIQGDGVGIELCASLQQVFSAAKVPVQFEIFTEHNAEGSQKVLPALVDSLRRNKIGIKGPIANQVTAKDLRKALDFYAFVAVCKSLEGQQSPYGKLDCVIIRDVMEGEYSGIEHSVVPGVFQSIKVSTAAGAKRIARYVFKYAKDFERKKVTVAHKANIMTLTDGNFLHEMRAEAVKHREKCLFEEKYMDTACLNLIMWPDSSDILVSSSMYGDVLVMMAASIMGGKSLCPGFCVSGSELLFDTLNKPNLDIAGQGKINPTGMLLAGVLLLSHLKLDSYANVISCAIKAVYKDTDLRLTDTGGKATTSEFTDAVCKFISENNEVEK